MNDRLQTKSAVKPRQATIISNMTQMIHRYVYIYAFFCNTGSRYCSTNALTSMNIYTFTILKYEGTMQAYPTTKNNPGLTG